MTKDKLQAELLAKIKPGTKPSQLKKSKSTGDLPTSKSPLNQPRRKSINPLAPTESLTQQLEVAQDKIATLELKLEVQEREIAEKEVEKQALQKQLEGKSSNQELDQSLFARHKNLKDWFQQYQKTQTLDQELSENLNEASNELIEQDQRISQLQSEKSKLKTQNKNLTQDLELTQKLAQLRRSPLPSPDPLNYLRYFLYVCSAVWLILILIQARKIEALNSRLNHD